MKYGLPLPEDRLAFSAPVPVHHSTAVIPSRHLGRWIEPWYVAYAILGALASGSAVILIPLAVTARGGSATQIGAAIAAQNLGALFAPFWGWLSDRFKDYRPIFFGGFLLIGAGFLAFALTANASICLVGAFLIGFGTGASNTVACLFVVEFTPASEWGQRISWLQTFNAIGSVLGLAGAGLLRTDRGMLLSALLVVPALLVGGWGLPVPGGKYHVPHVKATRALLASVARRVEPLTGWLHTFPFFRLQGTRYCVRHIVRRVSDRVVLPLVCHLVILVALSCPNAKELWVDRAEIGSPHLRCHRPQHSPVQLCRQAHEPSRANFSSEHRDRGEDVGTGRPVAGRHLSPGVASASRRRFIRILSRDLAAA